VKKAILIGDYEIARLHPLAGIDDALREVFKDVFEIYTANEKVYPNLNYNSLTQYDLIIFMSEKWSITASKELVASLVTYVVNGGCLLAIHHGLIVNNTYELNLLFASRYKGHAPYCELDYLPTESDCSLAEGIAPITAYDEPYMFDMDVFKKTNVIMEMVYGNYKYPAIWFHYWGKGKVACMAPGHSAESIRVFAAPLRNIGIWMSGDK